MTDTTKSVPFGGMTQQDQDWHRVFTAGTALQQADILAAFAAMADDLQRRGYTCAADHRRDRILGAVARYIVESQQ